METHSSRPSSFPAPLKRVIEKDWRSSGTAVKQGLVKQVGPGVSGKEKGILILDC